MIGESFEQATETRASAESSVHSAPTDSAEGPDRSGGKINELLDRSFRELDGTTVSAAEVNAFLEATVSVKRVDARERAEREDTSRELVEEYKERTERLEAIRVGLLTGRLSPEQYDELKGFTESTADTMRMRKYMLNPAGLEKFIESASSFVK